MKQKEERGVDSSKLTYCINQEQFHNHVAEGEDTTVYTSIKNKWWLIIKTHKYKIHTMSSVSRFIFSSFSQVYIRHIFFWPQNNKNSTQK